MTEQRTASQQITNEVTSWPGVEVGTNARGGDAFRVDRREIGHLHGDHALHTGFPKDLWTDLKAKGRSRPPGLPGQAGAGRAQDRGR